ncbi:Uncharacterized protein Fot_14997 [Forsythia ovata]|uniref:Uncharacterized protein n=1 Tax=Forsythia ovata TaxID=205694 RepID=A0ABD1W7Z8_9LAMI
MAKILEPQLHSLIQRHHNYFNATQFVHLSHGNQFDNVVRVSIGSRDYFDIFFFNPHVSFATIKVQLDERLFDIFLAKDGSQWKVQEYPSNVVALWKVEALLDMLLHPSKYLNEVYSRFLEAEDMEEEIEQSEEED